MPTGYTPPGAPPSAPIPPAPLAPPQPDDWVRDPQRWAVVQERQRHEDALYAFGEYAMFVLLWNAKDEANGLITRCTECYLAEGKIADAFGQGARERCPSCFGTTFEGGYRALIVRPSLWSDTDEEDVKESTHGHYITSSARVEATHDFTMHTGDYIFRGDGTRWKVAGAPDSLSLHTGLETKSFPRAVNSWSAVTANREDESSVAYDILYDTAQVIDLLDRSYTRLPLDYSDIEDIRGALLL